MSVRAGERIERAVRAAVVEGRPALSAFLTAGYPDRRSFRRLLRGVARAVDLIEIGVPFSDPMADGVTIQRSSRVALRHGITLDWILETLREAAVPRPCILMSYLNPLLAYGVGDLAVEAAAAGAAGFIVPDLPWEESGGLRERLDTRGLALVQLVSPVTPRSRLPRLCRDSRGFVYAVTMTGTTGGRAPRLSDIREYLDRVRAASSLPVLAGFGIRTPAQLREISAHADGVIVGSALIEALEREDDPVAFLRRLRAATASRREVPG